jgi:hypothetical protein
LEVDYPMNSHWTPIGLPADSQLTPSTLPADTQGTPIGLPMDSQQTHSTLPADTQPACNLEKPCMWGSSAFLTICKLLKFEMRFLNLFDPIVLFQADIPHRVASSTPLFSLPNQYACYDPLWNWVIFWTKKRPFYLNLHFWKSRSWKRPASNLRKISGPANLIFFLGLP